MTVTRDTPWRHLGAVPYEVWRKRILDAGGLPEAAGREVWEACGDDSALMLAMLKAESSYASDFDAIPASKRNPWNLQIAGVGLSFATIREGALAWRARLYDANYKQGIYARTKSIADLIAVYAPKSDGNDTEGYIRKVIAEIERNGLVTAGDPPVTAPGTGEEQVSIPQRLDYSSLPFPVEVKFIPVGQLRQRTGIPMVPKWTTWHDTGNPAIGARSDMHHTWMLNGCQGPDGPTYTSWHFTVDDRKAIQHIPLNEVAWHAGDGNGPGNYTSIAIEECVNSDRNADLTRRNAAMLHALLIRELGLQGGSIEALVQHNRWSGKNCPATIRAQNLWATVRTMTAGYIGTVPRPPAEPVYAKPDKPPAGSHIRNDRLFLAVDEEYTLTRDETPRVYADRNSAPTGPALKKGTKVRTTHVVSDLGESSDLTLVLVDGSRIDAKATV